ncbi:MAG: DUF2069 domain-containing protein [Pseudomonadota bacterium]
MPAQVIQLIASTTLIALIFLCLLWEAVLAPIRPGGTLMTIKALPLLLPLLGILRGRVYTYQWSSMLILLYFTEGVVRLWSDQGVSKWLAAGEVALSLIFFSTVIYFVRARAQTLQKQ